MLFIKVLGIFMGMCMMHILLYMIVDKEKIKINDKILKLLSLYTIIGVFMVYPILWKYNILYSIILIVLFPISAFILIVNIRNNL